MMLRCDLAMLAFAMVVVAFQCIPVASGEDVAYTTVRALIERADRNVLEQPRMMLRYRWTGEINKGLDDSSHVNLTHGAIVAGRVRLWHMLGEKCRLEESPYVLSKLPPTEDLAACTNLSDLVAKLDDPFYPTSVWESREREHWTAGWVVVALLPNNKLKYLRIHANVSCTTDAESHTNARVDRLQIYQGVLVQEPTPQSVPDNGSQARVKTNATTAHPISLKHLTDAYERDSLLASYRESINEYRQHPNKELIEELVSEMHEGSMRIQSHLENVLIGRGLALDPWGRQRKVFVVETVLRSMRLVENDATATRLVAILLKMNGSGMVEIGNRNGVGGTQIICEGSSCQYKSIDTCPSIRQTKLSLRNAILTRKAVADGGRPIQPKPTGANDVAEEK